MQQHYRREEYVSRINRALDYIQDNLHRPLSLGEIARAAAFSPYHFHRIFGAIVGETLNQFIQRVRVEKAGAMLMGNPKKSITEVALDCGFSGSASFARAFREAYGMSASQWREGGHRDFRKIRKTDGKIGKQSRKDGKESNSGRGYLDGVNRDAGANQPGVPTTHPERSDSMSIAKDVRVEVRDMPEMTVAYVRHIGPYMGDGELFKGLWARLMTWAGPRNLLRQPDLRCLSVYHDDPEITDESRLRTSVCITVPPDTKVEGEIGKMTIPGGRYAAARFELDESEFGQAWQYVFGTWLPQSGYQPDDRPAFELCLNNPEEHPEGKHIVEICIPVKPL
jgi:AraC family transcriptional regulator